MPKLSIDAIKDRIADLQKKLAAAESNKAPAIKKVKALMKKLGVTLEDLRDRVTPVVANPKNKGRARKVAIKYRDDKGNTWTGRGKTPRWLVEAEKAGKSRDAFKV